MPAVLTEATTLQCVHGGIFQAKSGQDTLAVDGQKVLLEKDLENVKFETCPVRPKPCTTTTKADAGASTKLSVGKQPVLLDNAQGLTDQGTWLVVTAGQTKLEAA